MNHPWLRKLLDIESIPADATDLAIVWQHPWPAWVWFLLILLAATFAWWTYFHIEGRRSARVLLAGLRAAALVAILLLISGPMLEMPRERTEEDWVVFLADRSASMNVADVAAGSLRRTRDDQLRGIVDANGPLWNELDTDRQLVWLGFHQGAFDIAGPTSAAAGADTFAPSDLGPSDGWRTNINAALEQALQRAAARPLSGIVIFSDGRTTDPPSRALVKRLQSENIRVSVVPLGSADATGDLAVRRVDAPRRAFLRDRVPVAVEIDRTAADSSPDAVVTLVDRASGRELDRRSLSEAGADGRIMLSGEPSAAGAAEWSVTIDSGGADLIPENNTSTVSIELIDRPLRVLYIDGYPRWEYRYVKNLLVREASTESSIMLLSADRDFAQEGNTPISRLPRTAEEFAAYDVIIIGDVPATFFTSEQIDLMRDQVARRGAGMLWIGGPRYTPATYAGCSLVDLLPIRGNLTLDTLDQPITLAPTPLAERLGILQMAVGDDRGWPAVLSDETSGWSALQWAQHIPADQLKPTAEVIAHTVQPIDQVPAPIVVHMRFGAGRVLYVATDEIWRWRYGRGELFPEQFWLQLVRLLGRETLGTGAGTADLVIDPDQVLVGQPAQVVFRVNDEQALPPALTSVGASELSPSGHATDLILRRVGGDEGAAEFVATVVPDSDGSHTVTISDPLFAQLQLSASVMAQRPDDELRHPEADHTLLAALAHDTGGRVLDPADLAALRDPQVLPNRAVTTVTSIRENIWNTPLAFALVLLLLTFEWVGRKLLRLT